MSSFRTLSELVSTALTDATHQIKVASAASVPRFGGTDVDFLKLAGEDTAHEEPKSKKDEKDEKKSKKEEDGEKRAAVSYAMKVAEALELAAPIVQKLAEADRSPIDAPGPAVMAGSQMGAASFPKSPKAATDPGKEGVGAVGTLATNAKDLKSADWTKNKEASEAFVATKIAQAKLLRDLGQVEAADAILSKIAQDPSSPQPNLPPNSGGGIRPAVMPSVPSGPVPDSAQGVAAMTKGQAKDPSVRSVSEFIQQTPGKDPAVAATQLTAAGQKVSSLLAVLRGPEAEKVAVSSDWIAKHMLSGAETLAKKKGTGYDKLMAAAQNNALGRKAMAASLDVGEHALGKMFGKDTAHLLRNHNVRSSIEGVRAGMGKGPLERARMGIAIAKDPRGALQPVVDKTIPKTRAALGLG